jgi:phosphoribosylglycinamide formyltransferase 2
MVTLAGTQNLSEFELHLRAVLGLPIPEISLERAGASAVILASREGTPSVTGLEAALAAPRTDVRIFGKPTTRAHRRMGVALAWDEKGADARALVEKAKCGRGLRAHRRVNGGAPSADLVLREPLAVTGAW